MARSSTGLRMVFLFTSFTVLSSLGIWQAEAQSEYCSRVSVGCCMQDYGYTDAWACPPGERCVYYICSLYYPQLSCCKEPTYENPPNVSKGCYDWYYPMEFLFLCPCDLSGQCP